MKRLINVVILLLFVSGIGIADGFVMPVIPRPVPSDFPRNPLLNVKYHHVDVDISDPVAVTKIDQVFVNPYNRELEADYIFPIPEGAVIDAFTAYLNGREMHAELLDAKDARKIYEDIVRKRQDPALLEYADKGMYRLRVYPIPARGEVRIKIEYKQTLKSDYGTVEYIYPLNTEKYSGSNLEDCRVEIRLESFENIGSAYCPSHDTKTRRVNDKEFSIIYYEENVKPDKDLALYFTRQKKDFGFHLLSYKEPRGSKGYFLGILSPPLESNLPDIPKNLIFVLDSSGSMKGDKFEQAMSAMEFVLLDLKEGDKFGIIDYDDVVRPYNEELISASTTNIKDAIRYAKDSYDANGGTNIYEALERACNMIPRDDRPTYILFLTDGLPTVGNRDINAIAANTKKLNESRARLFVFGVGYDVNAILLDRLASDNNGSAEYVLPNEDIEVKVSRLATKISRPALTDVKLSFAGVKSEHIYPNPVPDLFYGSEIIIAGRYTGDGNDQAVVTGKIAGKSKTYEFPIEFKKGSAKDEFIALLWANRRIAYLTQEIRMHGEDDELIDEIVALSKKHGIITDYTSFLITGDEQYAAEEMYFGGSRLRANESFKDNLAGNYSAPSGAGAVRQSDNIGGMQKSGKVYKEYAIDLDKAKVQTKYTQVGAQNFVNISNNWIQGDLEDEKYDMEIKNFSSAYFKILELDPSLGRYLGLGENVRIQIGDNIVQFSNKGQESLSDSELKNLFPKL